MKHLLLLILAFTFLISADWSGSDREKNHAIWLIDQLGSSPSNPASGKLKVFSKSLDGNLYKLDSSGIESRLGGGGGGSGGQNFIAEANPDAEIGIAFWSDEGTGTLSFNSVTPINGVNDFLWDSTAQNDFVTTDSITVPQKFRNKSCQVEFTYSGSTDDLVKPLVYNSVSTVLDGAVYENQVDGSDFLKAQTEIVTRSLYFICPDSGDISFRFVQFNTGTVAAMNFDDVHVGELIGLQTTVLDQGEWTPYTPTITGFGTPTNVEFFYRRDGTDRLITGRFTLGTPTAVDAKISIGPNATIDVANISTSDTGFLGPGNLIRTGVLNRHSIFSDGVDTDEVFISIIGVGADVYDKSDGNAIGVATDNYTVNFRVPIVENESNPVTIYNSIPKVSENINNYSALITNNGTSAVFSENTEWINGDCTRPSAGYVQCTLQDLSLTNVMACGCTVDNAAGNQDRGCVVDASTTSTVDIRTNNAGTSTDLDFKLECEKQLVDFKMPTVQPILVNQLQTHISEGMKIASCRVDNNGTATINDESGLCAGFINTVNRSALGVVDITWVTDFWTNIPTCNCSGAQQDTACGYRNGSEATTSGVSFDSRDGGGVGSDKDTIITCFGKR